MRKEIPEPVSRALVPLKQKHRHHLELQKRSDGFYVFETTVRFDQTKQRKVKLALYLGKIEDNGKFIPPIRKKNSTRDITNLDEYIKRLDSEERQEEKQYFESKYEPLILKELSTNPRDGVAAISKRIGLPYSTTLYWIRKLGKKYGIRYTIEPLFLNRFGLFRFVAIAKFKNKRPKVETLRKLLESKPQIQAAFMAKGAYDFFMFFLAPDPAIAEDLVYEIRSDKALASYPSHWYSSYYTQGLGYIPLRDELFTLLKGRVWARTKETPHKHSNQLFLREYATLKELNSNGMVDFSEIDRKYGLKEGSAQYTYHKLLSDKMILRITVAMERPPINNTAVFITEQINIDKFNKNKKDFLNDEIAEENKPLNKYIFSGDIGSPYGLILIAPLYEDKGYEITEQGLLSTAKGVNIKASVITEMLVGRLSYRNLDLKKTLVYQMLTTEHWEENPDNVALRKLE